MQRWAVQWPLTVLAAAMSIASGVAVAARLPRDVSSDRPDFIGLADPDEGVRTSTRERLSNTVASLAEPIASGLGSDDPEVRSQSAMLLLNRPWTAPADDDMVRQLLANYGSLGADARCDQIDLLAGLPSNGGRQAIVRILKNDPCAGVRWAAMTALRAHLPATPTETALFARDIQDTGASAAQINVPLEALIGWAIRESDPVRARQILQNVIDAEREHPTAVRGQLDVVFLWLADRATSEALPQRVLSLLRQEARQQPWDTQTLPDTVGAILSLHAMHGPLDGLLDDINAASGYWDRPELLYCLARWANRCDLSSLSTVADGVSLMCSGMSSDAHESVGSFLLSQGWIDPAEREFTAAEWLSGGQSVNAWFELSRVASMRDDDLGVAENLQQGLQLLSGQELHRTSRYGEITPWANQDAWADVHWHFLRAAMKANDAAAIDLHLQKLLELNKLKAVLDSDPGLAADIVPALRKLGRNDEADRCFTAAFKSLHDAVTAAPGDAEALNNLAWLCACAGEHLTEAEAWARRAVTAAPAVAAYLDTAAEVQFRHGNPAEAAAIESRAVALQPQDVFMRHQLQAFTEAARAAATRP